MMYKRQKILLSLITLLESSNKTRIQKLMFLVCRDLQPPPYYFFPYKFGPFSFSLDNDLKRLTEKELITVSDREIICNTQTPFLDSEDISKRIKNTIKRHAHKDTDSLISYVYHKYPYYASRSEIRERYQVPAEESTYYHKTPDNSRKSLYTIGYEGRTIDSYLDLLILNNIRLLVDVRASAYSMKPDFIGGRLKNYCRLLGIEYRWIPELGIPSKLRKDIPDRNELLSYYKEEILPEATIHLKDLKTLIKGHSVVALTCMEFNHNDCHRSMLASYLANDPEPSVTHL